MFTIPQLIIFCIFCANTTLAMDLTIRFAMKKKPNTPLNRTVFALTISSTIWSLGMGMMSIQTNLTYAYYWRIFGILGTFMFMMAVQKSMCIISELPNKAQVWLNGISYLGIIVFLMYIVPGQTTFVHTTIGVSFYFTMNIVNIIYASYFTIVCGNIAAVTFHTIKRHPLQRTRNDAKRFVIVEMLVFAGALTDMVMPVFGMTAFPGSAITHFWGVVIYYYAIKQMYRSTINISNMSEFVYDSLDIPVLVFDADYNLRISNGSSDSFLGVKYDSETNQIVRISDIFNTDDSIYDFEERSTIKQATCLHNDARCELAISKICDKYGDIIGYILIANDLTEHELVITKLEQAKLAADSANMSKSLFLANMSHEIRTPLNAIIGFSQIALSEDMDAHAKEYFSDINQSGETLLAIINDVLNISKIELGQNELKCNNYKPAKLFKDLELITSVPAGKKGLKLNINIDSSVPNELYGDKDKLREILINLLNNSVKYTKQGEITFDVSWKQGSGSQSDMAYMIYKVTDTGIGIKPENLESIFDKFHRVDSQLNSSTEGTGLGLSITKGLVEMMDGDISVESEYGVGSTFTVTIPQKVINSAPIQLETSVLSEIKTAKVNLKDLTFLAVDDNGVNLRVISTIMKKYNIKHQVINSGKGAINLCKENRYDIILMDQMMPEMDGVEAMKQIRSIPGYEKGSASKLVALTANVIEGTKETLLLEGFDGYLGKPLTLKAFEGMLKEQLGNNILSN